MECSNFTARLSGIRLRDALSQAANLLARAGIENATLDAEVLHSHGLGLTREELIVTGDSTVSAEQAKRCAALLARRLQREPVAYIVGRQEFWSLEFQVTPDVLIPRPDTESLVEVALRLAAASPPAQSLRVLDVGTGSGAIAIALAKELPLAENYASDIDPSALTIAHRNAVLNGVACRINFFCGDLFEGLGNKRFDLIVCNPPYIRSAEIDTLKPEVSRWEPRSALDGGVDGLDYYRRIAFEAGRFLTTDGAVVLEIGASTGEKVLSILARARFCRGAEIVCDYAGRE